MNYPKLVTTSVASEFPIAVIELPKKSYHSQSKSSMRVASISLGWKNYAGPQRMYWRRWKHIHSIYIFEMSNFNYYHVQSLTNHPHYSILASELPHFEKAISVFQQRNPSLIVNRITRNENFFDSYLIVINDFTLHPEILNYVKGINDTDVLHRVLHHSTRDANRGNWKLDFGYSSGQNLQRDPNNFGLTRPRLLDQTTNPTFLMTQMQLTHLSDLISTTFDLPFYHRLDDIHKIFCDLIQPNSIIPSWRIAIHDSNSYVEIHEDSLNDSRPLMSPVGVLSAIYCTEKGPIRLTKIGYSRQSLCDCLRRAADLQPVIKQFLEWLQYGEK
jgi:hypothetical protein